jgi:hypothetical protein
MSVFVKKKVQRNRQAHGEFYRTISSIIDATQPEGSRGPILPRAIALEVIRAGLVGDKTDLCVSQ